MFVDEEYETTVYASLESSGELDAAVECSAEVGASISGNPAVPSYSGEYELIPDFEEHRLATKNKKMLDDVRMTAIPVHYVSNESGGTTVTIGRISVSNG